MTGPITSNMSTAAHHIADRWRVVVDDEWFERPLPASPWLPTRQAAENYIARNPRDGCRVQREGE